MRQNSQRHRLQNGDVFEKGYGQSRFFTRRVLSSAYNKQFSFKARWTQKKQITMISI